jgi:hypothetical protein
MGRDTVVALPVPWRVLITILVGAGIALTLVGLWQALAAQAGTSARALRLEEIQRAHGSVRGFRLHLADCAADRLRTARLAVGTALALLLAAMLVTWWAPTVQPSPPAYVRVTTDKGSTCGRLLSADGRTIRLEVAGAQLPWTSSFAEVLNLAVTDDCTRDG